MSEDTATGLREQVRARYAEVASRVAGKVSTTGRGCCGPAAGGPVAPTAGEAACCGDGGTGEVFGAALYQPAERDGLPEAAVLASLGCGNPVAVAELRAGDAVLDLGSGGGIDVLLSAARVGPTGRAIGLDMTQEMLALARANAERAGAANVEFVKGTIEDIPLPDASIDVVISNCVVNLSVDKPAVFAGLARVLRPGGRIGISDVVAADRLTAAQRAERGSHVGCIAGALSESEYQRELAAAGFTDITVTFTHEVADGMHGAIIRAVRPTSQ
ncbi:MAG TPA: arsenite methyltransferase [Mycobacteriales bacterium]|nr:arsenite methyltransferase [Mycobacteriales bacterium]